MKRIRLMWRLYPSYLLILLAALAGTVWQAGLKLHALKLESVEQGLKSKATLFGGILDAAALSDSLVLERICKRAAAADPTRLTIIMPGGQVAGDTHASPGSMENHAGRPEVERAFRGETATAVRHSETLRRDLFYVAAPVLDQGKIVAVVRAALPIDTIEETFSAMYRDIILGGLSFAALAALICYIAARRISRPLEELKAGVERFAHGDFRQKLFSPEIEEMGALADAMNSMGSDIDSHIATIDRQRRELEAILDGMSECVIALDTEERILQLNRAAEALFGTDAGRGKFLQEVARNSDLHVFADKVLKGEGQLEGELIWRGQEDRFFQARGRILRGKTGVAMGAILVLNEITRLHKLEKMRRDFVANVSHELKTPITSIRGYAETMLDETVEPEKAKGFLAVILRQAKRLNAIVDDLLNLARIERQAEREEMELKIQNVQPVLAAAVQSCGTLAAERGVTIDLSCQEGLQAALESEALERAVSNLLDNAIKYSAQGTSVLLECAKQDKEIHIKVKDTGCGIPSEHLPHLFERFYRVDKARSRAVGGTGLGLSIVKHVSLAHKGRVAVESVPGKGSTFSIILPTA